MEHVTNEMIFAELQSIKKELVMLEHAVIPVEKLSANELAEHQQDLQDALKGGRTSFRKL